MAGQRRQQFNGIEFNDVVRIRPGLLGALCGGLGGLTGSPECNVGCCVALRGVATTLAGRRRNV